MKDQFKVFTKKTKKIINNLSDHSKNDKIGTPRHLSKLNLRLSFRSWSFNTSTDTTDKDTGTHAFPTALRFDRSRHMIRGPFSVSLTLPSGFYNKLLNSRSIHSLCFPFFFKSR